MALEGSSNFAPELVIAFVAPTGLSFEDIAAAARERLSYYRYDVELVRLSDFLEERAGLDEEAKQQVDTRITALQDEGNKFRRDAKRGDALAFVAVNEIRERRQARWMSLSVSQRPTVADDETLSDRPHNRVAYLVWSLKHPAEVDTLRNVYRSRFVLISLYASRMEREGKLTARIAQSRAASRRPEEHEAEARAIIDRDEAERNTPGYLITDGIREFGQDVRDTYPKADFFVDAGSRARLQSSMTRTVDILFGAPFETPTKDEYGMYFAHAAELRSAELGRQVGASICTPEGSIVSAGTNEVPSPRGGQYWAEDYDIDQRQFQTSGDISDQLKQELAAEVLDHVKPFLAGADAPRTGEQMYDLLADTGLRDLIEYGRAVHAELAAIADAASRGVSIAGATMFVTTFPCHHCAGHVVAAGIRRLVYIYPYAKSLARILHGDAIAVEPDGPETQKVRFEPFLGVAPRQYSNFFTMPERKRNARTVPPLDPDRTPRLIEEERAGVWNVNAYIQRERYAVRDGEDFLADVKGELK
jgi:deoxycytidylate deaminase